MSTAALLPAQREVLRQASADAAFSSQCTAGLTQARPYLALSRKLEISPARPDGHPGGPAHLATR